ncbi:nitrilase-related carbon-nitrogen hydrolase, partial [Muribaculum sp.]|uniref:nitrilase-related carbon-nitrogen hydrolase n=1 Tax=Muribaculum sp. TaxID=1918611 RepID=UPI003745E410
VFITPSGEETFYAKRHRFTMSGEDSVYTRGSSAMPVVAFRGWNVAFAVCFDLRFPVWLRNRGKAYDLLIVMANWPDSRAYAWQQLLIARAIENQAYVIGCNRSGSDKFGVYSGTSHIIEPKGHTIETIVTPVAVEAQLSMESLVGFRNKFPVYLEGDNFELL